VERHRDGMLTVTEVPPSGRRRTARRPPIARRGGRRSRVWGRIPFSWSATWHRPAARSNSRVIGHSGVSGIQ